MPNAPHFTIQTASLFASGDDSTFTGTGGPAAFDPFTAEFSDTVSSAGIAGEPFNDEVYDVDAGDQVTFVIAIQNFGLVAGYNLKVRDTIPLGFSLTGANLTVTDGAGNDLAYSGILFDSAGGLTVTPPVAAYSDNSGANVVLITFTTFATNSVTLPGATLTNAAQIVGYAATSGGANLASGGGSALSATTPVQTGVITVSSTADQPAATLQAGQTASFDVTVALPEGSVGDLRIDEVLPQVGQSYLQLVSVQIVSFGGHLTASAPVFVQPSGSIQLGTVVDAADNLPTADDNIVVRVTVQGAGTAAGSGTLNTVISTADPAGGARLSQTVTQTVSLGAPDTPPALGGVSAAQFATDPMVVLPFKTVTLTDPDAAQTQTLTIHLSDATLGSLAGAGLTTNGAGDYVLSGPVASVQTAVRGLLFTPAATASGSETFSLTVNDGAGGVATAQAGLTLTPDAHGSTLTRYPISTQTVLTSTVSGTSTYSEVEAYSGPVSGINTQLVYGGSANLAIVAQQAGLLVSTQAPQTAVQLLAGTNLIETKQGSGFLTSGTGNDTFLFHVDQPQVTWNTLVNFHVGDTAILYGFAAGTSTRSLSASDGAAGYTGATLRIDADGNGSIDSLLTFAARTATDVGHYTFSTGGSGSQSYLSITAA